MATLRRIALISTLTAALALAAIQAAGATGGSGSGTRTLAGEEFLVNDVTMTIQCDDPSQPSTVHFSATGLATGPYPGTFAAQGTATIEPQTLPGPRPGTVAGSLLSFDETFTIDSPLGTVAGHKTLQAGQPFDQSQGTCLYVTDFATGPVSNASGTVVELFSQPAYEATIQEASGVYHVHGETLFNASELDLVGVCAEVACPYRLAGFSEFFLTSIPVGGDDEDEDEDDDEHGNGQHDQGTATGTNRPS